jgi:hypothetical protein
MTKKSKVAVIPNLRASELAQAAKLMMYVTADMADVSRVFCLFEEWHTAIAPCGGHTVQSVVLLQRTISEYAAAVEASRLSTVDVAGMASGLETVTSHKLAHLPETAGALGYANAGDTAFSEAKHKAVKKAWQRTAKRPETVGRDVAVNYQHSERVAASFESSSVQPTTRPIAARAAQHGNKGVGNHPNRELSLAPFLPRGHAGPPLGLRQPVLQNLWPVESLGGTATGKAQVDIVVKALRAYYTSLGLDFGELQTELMQTPIALLAGIRLFDSANANSIIGIARASPRWGRSVRYNDVRVVFDAGPLRYARLALVMRVRDEDVVLIRLYREPPDIGKRSAARESLDALLGTMLEFVPASDAEAWAIVPVASVHDVWKLEDDVRKRGRYFVNQFVGAYRPTEDAADEDAEDDAVDEAV